MISMRQDFSYMVVTNLCQLNRATASEDHSGLTLERNMEHFPSQGLSVDVDSRSLLRCSLFDVVVQHQVNNNSYQPFTHICLITKYTK